MWCILDEFCIPTPVIWVVGAIVVVASIVIGIAFVRAATRKAENGGVIGSLPSSPQIPRAEEGQIPPPEEDEDSEEDERIPKEDDEFPDGDGDLNAIFVVLNVDEEEESAYVKIVIPIPHGCVPIFADQDTDGNARVTYKKPDGNLINELYDLNSNPAGLENWEVNWDTVETRILSEENKQ